MIRLSGPAKISFLKRLAITVLPGGYCAPFPLPISYSSRLGEDKAGEFRAIVNYGLIGLIQLSMPPDAPEELPFQEVSGAYDEKIAVAKSMMTDKNHDYGEAWREMSQESFVDLILMKILRIRQILANDGKTLVSEGIDSNFTDIINYSLFALILIEEGKQTG
jgi:hypothetical protein